MFSLLLNGVHTGRKDVIFYHTLQSADCLNILKDNLLALYVEHSCNDCYCSPEGSATSSISGVNPTSLQSTDQSTTIGTPKPPPGYGDDLSCNLNESDQQTTSTTSVVGKWPLKPGVLVHSKQQLLKMQSSVLSQSSNTEDDSCGPKDKNVFNENDKLKSKKNNNSSKVKLSADSIMLTNETQSSRTARIRRMMIGSNNNISKKPSPTSPPPAPPVRENADNIACSTGEKYPNATGRQITKRDHSI